MPESSFSCAFMQTNRNPGSVLDQIKSTQSDRCDLDILLRDHLRHRAVVRDLLVDHAFQVTDPAVLAIPPHLLPEEESRLAYAAFVLAGLHEALAAYGDGQVTVVALDVQASASWVPDDAGIRPTIMNHRRAAEQTRASVIDELVAALANSALYPNDLLGQGLFDAVMVWGHSGKEKGQPLPRVPLALLAESCSDDTLQLRLRFSEQMFDAQVIGGLLSVISQAIGGLWREPMSPISSLELISAAHGDFLDELNHTDGDYPQGVRLETLFEIAVRANPDATAIQSEGMNLSYAQVAMLADRVADAFADAANSQPSAPVGILLEKSHLPVIAALGLWKAGLSYVPLDLGQHIDRIRFILGDLGVARVITSRGLRGFLDKILADLPAKVQVDAIERLTAEPARPSRDRKPSPPSEAIAYVTYTSGTTGVPKGVAKEHESVVNSITDLSIRYGMTVPQTERVALFASFVFEPFMRQALIALVNGQTLVVVPDAIRDDPLLFPGFLREHGITYLNGTRSVIETFDLRSCPDLKRLLLVGEELTARGLAELRKMFSGWIVNEYAFTETAFVTAVKMYAPGASVRTDRSIGRPLRNVKCYVLSQNGKRVPVGAVGELYIGGLGVAKGYVNRPDLTASRFIANAFQSDRERLLGVNDILYRTGDLARVLPSGELEFMGRADFQLKLNGIRVEPGEIEARILEHPDVSQCIVMPQGRLQEVGSWHLVGYYVCAEGASLAEEQLLDFITVRVLPTLAPARLIRLDSLPININGKIDRGALASLAPSTPVAAARQPSRREDVDDVTAILRDLWGGVLAMPPSAIADTDDFFRLGGQSITAMRLILALWRTFRVHITLEDIHHCKSLAMLADQVRAERAAGGGRDVIAPDVDEVSAPVRANGLQQGLVYRALKDEGAGGAYVMQSFFRYGVRISPAILRAAWAEVIGRHPSLRTHFIWRDEAFQVLGCHGLDDMWRDVDLGACEVAVDAAVAQLRRQDREQGYDLFAGPLVRIYGISLGGTKYAVLLSCHHAIVDGWSLQALYDEVHAVYLAFEAGETPAAVDPDPYLAVQRHIERHRKNHLVYWSEQASAVCDRADFSGLQTSANGSALDVSVHETVQDQRSMSVTIGDDVFDQLRQWGRDNRITLHSILQFAWHQTLATFTGMKVTSVGTVVSGRNLPFEGMEGAIGLFSSTLPIIVMHDPDGAETVLSLLRRIQVLVNAANDRGAVDLGEIDSAGAKRSLFDTLFVLENYPRLLDARELQRHQERFACAWSADTDVLDYPLAIVAREGCDKLDIEIWFAGELFDDWAVQALLESVEVVLGQIVISADKPVSSLQLLSKAQAERLDSWNRTESPSLDGTIPTVFESVVRRHPDRLAVKFGDRELSYRQLNAQANRLARVLRDSCSLRPGDLVALVLDKSELMIVAIFAVWKAGAAYVPIDAVFPDERITYMLNDTGARLVLADATTVGRVGKLRLSTETVLYDVSESAGQGGDAANLDLYVDPTALAYAIYTSGTTGRPKAVLVEHHGVVNLYAQLANLFGLRQYPGTEVVLSFSNYTFDHFVEQMLDALLSGQVLLVLPDVLRSDRDGLRRYMLENKVTYLSGTPSVLSLYRYNDLPDLKRIDAIGEDFTRTVFDKLRRDFGGLIINGYGPTEISITSHKRLYPSGEPRLDKSIGFPVGNTTCYILDKHFRRLPVGSTGELYIGGAGVTRGYLNMPELTAERFVQNPYQSVAAAAAGRNAVLYRTGDLARWLPNGEIEYLGRNDHQVKINGQRIELGEVEAALASYPGLARAIVIARKDEGSGASDPEGPAYLAAYYVAGVTFDHAELVAWMQSKLPLSHVPRAFLRIFDVPVNVSGKLDVSSLPCVLSTDRASGGLEEAMTDVEHRVVSCWRAVLGAGASRGSPSADFFALGGDSFKAIRLAQALSDEFGCRMTVADIFKAPTARQQANLLAVAGRADGSGRPSLAGLSAAAPYGPPATVAQKQLVLIDEYLGGSSVYNIPVALGIDLTSAERRAQVVRALDILVRRHASLRTLITNVSSGGQRLRELPAEHGAMMLTVEELAVDSRDDLDEALRRQASYVFRLGRELPVRAAIFVSSRADLCRLCLLFHHTCFDGWSWRIFSREFSLLLSGLEAEDLPDLDVGFADFAVWQAQELADARPDEAYWRALLDGYTPAGLPTDYPRLPMFDYQGAQLSSDLEEGTLADVRFIAASASISMFTVLAFATAVCMGRFAGAGDIVIGFPSSGRTHPDVFNIVGYFANLLPLRARLFRSVTIAEALSELSQQVANGHLRQQLPFERIARAAAQSSAGSRQPLVQVVLSLEDEMILDDHEGPGANGSFDIIPNGSAKFDLLFTFNVNASAFGVNCTYARSLYRPETVANLITDIQRILARLKALSPDLDRVALADLDTSGSPRTEPLQPYSTEAVL